MFKGEYKREEAAWKSSQFESWQKRRPVLGWEFSVWRLRGYWRGRSIQKGEFAALLSLVIDTGLGSGINEELIFRGYVLKMTEKHYGKGTSLLLVSLVFGLLHLLNRPLPLMETVLFFAYTASLGILFAVMTFQSGNIWTGVLAHILVNTCGALFHFGSEAAAVSKTPGVFSYIFAEGLPVWLTGEEGAVPVFVTAAIWGLILLLARRREEVL